MPYIAIGPGIRTGAPTLADLLRKVDRPEARGDLESIDLAAVTTRRLLARRSGFEIRYVDKDHPEYGPDGEHVGGRALDDAELDEARSYAGGR